MLLNKYKQHVNNIISPSMVKFVKVRHCDYDKPCIFITKGRTSHEGPRLQVNYPSPILLEFSYHQAIRIVKLVLQIKKSYRLFKICSLD